MRVPFEHPERPSPRRGLTLPRAPMGRGFLQGSHVTLIAAIRRGRLRSLCRVVATISAGTSRAAGSSCRTCPERQHAAANHLYNVAPKEAP